MTVRQAHCERTLKSTARPETGRRIRSVQTVQAVVEVDSVRSFEAEKQPLRKNDAALLCGSQFQLFQAFSERVCLRLGVRG